MKDISFTFSTNRLLAQKPIYGKIEDFEFEIKQPTLFSLENQSVVEFISFLESDIEKYKKALGSDYFDDHFDLIILLLTLNKKNESIKQISSSVLEGFQYFIPEINFNAILKIKDKVVTKRIFYKIIEIIFKMFDKKYIYIKEEDDEFTKREKQAKIRAMNIRANAKEKRGLKKTERGTLEKMLGGILYEFPQYKLEDLFELNLYTVYYLFSFVGKIANYEISKIAYGNGLLKRGKHKHFTE